MANVAKEALSGDSKPEFNTVLKVIESFGLKLVAEVIGENKIS
jgi:DNA-binding phage protein